MKKFLLYLFILFASFLSNSYGQTPIVIKFSHVVANDTPKGGGALKFKELAEERTKGRVKVEIYPNSQLYKDKEELEALQLGAVQMLAPSVSKFGPLGVKEYEAFDLPFIFPNSEVLRSLFAKLESKGVKGLAYWDNGFKVMTANKPLHVPSDFKGLKLRIQSSKVLDAQMRALGANPQVLAFSEVYQAMQTGVVDGSENTPSNIYTQKVHDGYIGYAVIVNKKFWDGLPPDIRTILEGAMSDATKYANSIAQADNQRALEQIKASGKTQFITLSKAEKDQWREAFQSVYKEMAPRVGKDLIEQIEKETQSAK
jgi:C4-dicarboxylate-binding protein DctP